MAFHQSWIGTAAGLVLLLAAAPAGGAPLRLQGAGADAERPAAEAPVERGAGQGPAADFAADGVLPDAPDLDTIPFFAAAHDSFYVRVDAGFGAPTAGHAVTANGRFNPSLSGPVIAGAGVGYRLGYLLRADVTAEYRSDTDIKTADGQRASLSGAAVLANIYADIGTWYGVTPYVGAGAGVSWNRLSGAGRFAAGRDRTDFVWALAGGFSIEVTPQVSVDLGYRYLHTGTVRTPALALRRAGSHDLRLGLRWSFGKAASGDLP